ncbi:UNVERIFIED_CONTAM: flagellar basal body-associated protein FliL [Acetivibrio alkalicellulosi]
MAGKSGFFVLIGVVAFLSLTLALLAGYVFFVQGGSSKPVDAKDSNNIEINIPSESELIRERLFDERSPFNLKSTDGNISVIVVSIEISYHKKVKGIRDTTLKIESNKSKLQEMVGTYFQSLTIDEVKSVEAKEKARTELTKAMNEYLLMNEERKNDIIYTITFDQWFYQ